MKKPDLISAIASNAGISKEQAEDVLGALPKILSVALKEGLGVNLPGIGKFAVQKRAARTCLNPKTGAGIEVPAKSVPHFKAAKAFKDALL
jgi:DNA-binding protein HU-beta